MPNTTKYGRIVHVDVLLIVLIFVRPDLAPSWHTISEWAIGRYGWTMSAAFLISALSYAALFVMLRSQLHGSMGRIGLDHIRVETNSREGKAEYTDVEC